MSLSFSSSLRVGLGSSAKLRTGKFVVSTYFARHLLDALYIFLHFANPCSHSVGVLLKLFFT